MKKVILILVFAVSTAMVFNACSSTGSKEETEQTAEVKYTCSMHPEVIQDEPGDCPICGMALIEKKMDNQMDSTMMN